MLRLALLVAVALLVAACGGEDPGAPDLGDTDGVPGGTEGVPGSGAEPSAGPATSELTGVLGGDPTLEVGCAWLEVDGRRYEVVWPRGYEVAFDPLRLLGPEGEEVAAAGDEVTVVGTPAEGMASICQVGPMFRADQVVASG